ncbi:Uracil phosphoribosyltransferase [Penicillium ucsense]|uniref:uracil phosphoribosyltransferase n=1 Tax=Penicillium ucsense TaxID=2839758 RepID=A0A8J8W0I8_9EURO|nr:Uracil phosphoribosyltransferase [Penicillium ucsense]KAF7733614.1 Uracil phosphoribosyltransferase [Penicillium ucsense]
MSLPSNVHISSHPCLQAKLSQLRSQSTSPRETRALVEEISSILGVEAFAKGLALSPTGKDSTPLGIEYETSTIDPVDLALVPILRSGLGMVEAINSLLPTAVPIYHLGLFREPVGLQPVEYYNNLPFSKSALSPASPASLDPTTNTAAARLAVLLDPVIATGATADAAIQTLRDWGVQRVIMLSVLGSRDGVRKVAESWDQVEVWVGAVDEKVNEKGMIVPGLGDIGDRLFVALGK